MIFCAHNLSRTCAGRAGFLQRVYDAGDIYFGEFGGHYCYGCERFIQKRSWRTAFAPAPGKPAFISEKNYFFKMSRYLPWLRQYLEENPDFIRPARYRTEAIAMLESGDLEDLCILEAQKPPDLGHRIAL